MFNFLKRKKKININVSQNPRMVLEMFENNAYIYFSWPEKMTSSEKEKIKKEFSYYLYMLQTLQLSKTISEGLEQAGINTGQIDLANSIDLNTFNNSIKFLNNLKQQILQQDKLKNRIAILPSEVFTTNSGPN